MKNKQDFNRQKEVEQNHANMHKLGNFTKWQIAQCVRGGNAGKRGDQMLDPGKSAGSRLAATSSLGLVTSSFKYRL